MIEFDDNILFIDIFLL